ncbi:hypothetical protein [Streptomyces sp. 5-10]|uniref:hypothetical protein n=1 Tax=Streptomyces sp. 5-10 TaxID=878925 RepID=UPI00168B7D47|nr:hypothetical protein [Streptomyces sp. 5-10]MBD3004814.1 hypothetical protein [Streptomyces sp. 5-10]
MYTVTALARTGEKGGHYGTFTALFDGEETYGTGSELACAEAASVALHATDGGNLLLSRGDTPDGVFRVLAWRLLAGEAIPMSAEETHELHSKELGGTPVMPMEHVGCLDAYPIPEGNET